MSGLSNQSHESQVSNSTASATSHDETQKVNGIEAELHARHEHEQEDEEDETEYTEVSMGYARTVHLCGKPAHLGSFLISQSGGRGTVCKIIQIYRSGASGKAHIEHRNGKN